MKYVLNDLAIETTRRCNLRCGHCMRGECQNVDASYELIDMILGNEEIKAINHICFSGGEPTLNPDVIIYAIDKIISENLNVYDISMVTNGQVFNRELVEAFNRFNEYRNQDTRKHILERCSRLSKDLLDRLLKDNTDEHARITFSTDRFHHPVSEEVKENYKKYAKGLRITEYGVKDEKVYKTGFATIGKDFEYQLAPVRYTLDGDAFLVIDNIYVTSTGYVTSEAMGQYTDMDNINMGHISDTSITKMLGLYGTPVMKCPKIEPEKVEQLTI